MTKKREYSLVRECTLMGLGTGSGLTGGVLAMALNRRNRRGFVPGVILTVLSAAYAALIIGVLREEKQQAATQEKEYQESTVREESELGTNYTVAGIILSTGLVSGLVLLISGRRNGRPWRRRSGKALLGLTGLFGGLVGALISSFRQDARNERPKD